MSAVVNEVRRGTYLDSVALMRIAQAVKGLDGVGECGVLMATPANRRILADAGILAENGESAGPGDLVIAVRARDRATAAAAIAEARRLLARPRQPLQADVSAWQPRTLRSAKAASPDASLALISVPGAFAAVEAGKAIDLGLNVMLFSDNVPIGDEVALKRRAREQGCLLMGPDCGTAIIAGVPLGFANVVARGDIGIIGASGTGIQEIACLISNAGGGISHAIGTGGRDLKAEIGAISTLMAIDLLDRDPGTRHIVIVSKPPATEAASAVLARVARSPKTFSLCFLGGHDLAAPANARLASTLENAAQLALGRPLVERVFDVNVEARGNIRGLFAGGTLCAEAQVVLLQAGLQLASNAPIAGVADLTPDSTRHTLVDLGDDAFTLGRPHPMLEPAVRDGALAAALADPGCAVVLLDCVLGHGCHHDPAGHLQARLAGRPPGPRIVASVTGTGADPQRRSAQVAKLEAAGIRVASSNAEAARLAHAMAAARDD